jgi:hypothetical protein
MRHETCLSCLHPDPGFLNVLPAVLIAEAVSPHLHHHHRIHCVNCGAWWFDDVWQRPGLERVLEVELRDTRWCDCPEEAEFYRRGIVMVMVPEDECLCNAAVVAALPLVDLN